MDVPRDVVTGSEGERLGALDGAEGYLEVLRAKVKLVDINEAVALANAADVVDPGPLAVESFKGQDS
jgi:hypothetical protein